MHSNLAVDSGTFVRRLVRTFLRRPTPAARRSDIRCSNASTQKLRTYVEEYCRDVPLLKYFLVVGIRGFASTARIATKDRQVKGWRQRLFGFKRRLVGIQEGKNTFTVSTTGHRYSLATQQSAFECFIFSFFACLSLHWFFFARKFLKRKCESQLSCLRGFLFVHLSFVER